MKKKTTPTQRSLAKMRAEGWHCEITEHWNAWSHTRNDLLGFIDILCVKDNELLAVQTTSGANVNARIDKIRGLATSALWLASPSRRIIVHGWAKRGPRGQVKRWVCRQVELFQHGEKALDNPLATDDSAQLL